MTSGSVQRPLDERLAELREAAEAAGNIGLEQEAASARQVARRIGRRAGFAGGVYVMALAGGTGVGKSSILNALAGTEVSPARAVRPTTDLPVAWVAEERREEVRPLLEWLRVDRVVPHEGVGLLDVAVLDLPDVDSVRTEHRAAVDALLPRIDAIAWVVDPEKYDDARAHAYWRTLAPHASRMRFILNKADRLTQDAQALIVEDLGARLVADGMSRPVIHVVSAATGQGIPELRGALADAGHAKVVIASKMEADRRQAAAQLAEAVGLAPGEEYHPLLPERVRDARAREAVDGALGLVDVRGLARQIQAAVLHRARVRGGSLLGRLLALGGMLTGRTRRAADPAAYLRGWRTRGALGRVLNPLRSALVDAAAGVPPSSRGRVLEAFGTPTEDVARVLDRAVADAGSELDMPSSPVWPVVGVLQMAIGAVFVFAVAWIAVLFVAGGGVPVATFDAPYLGPVPMPLLLLAGAAILSALLGLLLGWHAGIVGRRVAARVGAQVERAVGEAVVRDAFAGLDRVEAARRLISAAGSHD